MRSKIVAKITFISVLSLLLIGQALASPEEYTFVTKWGSFGAGPGSGDGQFSSPLGIVGTFLWLIMATIASRSSQALGFS